MSDHSLFAPSGGAQLIHCAGSVLMQAQFPDEGDSVASAEGTAMHWWGAEYIAEDGSRPPVGAVAPNGVVITQTMADAAGQWIDTVDEICAESGTAAVLNVERKVDIPTVHELCFGTPDTDIWVGWSRTLHVIDFKGGFELHEPYEHIQCIEYAEGRMLELIRDHVPTDDMPALQDQNITVVITIVQPRAYHPMGPVRSWTCRGSDLRSFINRLHYQAHAALQPDPKCVTGPGCTHCTGRHVCLALQAKGYAAAEYINSVTAIELEGAALALEIHTLEAAAVAIKSRLSGLTEQGLAALRNGKPVPGYAIEHGRGSLDWIKPAADVVAMGDACEVDLRKPLAAITVTQAKKLLDDSVISAYSTRTPGKSKLARNDTSLAKQVFAK